MSRSPLLPWVLGFSGAGLLIAAVRNESPSGGIRARLTGDASQRQPITEGGPQPVGLMGPTAAGATSSAGSAGYTGTLPPLVPTADGWKPVTYNKHTSRPVDARGLTHEAYVVEQAVRAAFPTEAQLWNLNRAVERKVNWSDKPDAEWSPHAFGEALDLYPGKLGGNVPIPKAEGDRVAQWALNNMGQLPIKYVVWYHRYGDQNGWRPLSAKADKANPHTGHVHISITPGVL